MEEISENKYINIHTHCATPSGAVGDINIISERINDSEQDYSGSLRSIGIYPFDAEFVQENWFVKLRNAMTRDNVFALGETGLDYREPFRSFTSKQREIFKIQVSIANQVQKPLIIHQVRALEDTFAILNSATVPVIFHGFGGSSEKADRIINKGYYISFGHLLLLNEKTQSALRSVPIDRVFFETDDSPTLIEEIYNKAAAILNMEIPDLKAQVAKNFNDVNNLARENRTATR